MASFNNFSNFYSSNENFVKYTEPRLQDFSSRLEEDPFFNLTDDDDCHSFSPRAADTADSLFAAPQALPQAQPNPTYINFNISQNTQPQNQYFFSQQQTMPQYLPFNFRNFQNQYVQPQELPIQRNFQTPQVPLQQNFTQSVQPTYTPVQVAPVQNQQPVVQVQPKKIQVEESPRDETPMEPNDCLVKLAHDLRKDWKKIAKRYNKIFGTKESPTFLKSKYKELTDKDYVQRVKFSHKEDLMIVKYFEIHGTKWEEMSKFFSRRDPVMLKNRYYAFIRKRNLYDAMLEEVKHHEAAGDNIDEIVDNEKSCDEDNIDNGTPIEGSDEENNENVIENINKLQSFQAIALKAETSQDPEKSVLVNRVKELEKMLNELQGQVEFMKTRLTPQ